MTHRTLAALPLLFVAMTAAAVVLAPPEMRAGLTQGEVDVSKALAGIGMAAAALSFERGDYLRRGWGVWACAYVLLLGRDAVLVVGAGWSPLAFEVVRAVLVTGANVCVVFGAWTLARAWAVAGLEHPGSKGSQRAVLGVAVLVALALAGPSLYVDVRRVVMGESLRIDVIASDVGDILSLPLVAPVALTALAVQGGALKWPWTLLTSSLLAWILYDAVDSVPALLHVGREPFHLIGEQLHVLAGALACAAGLAQRKAVTDDEDDEAAVT